MSEFTITAAFFSVFFAYEVGAAVWDLFKKREKEKDQRERRRSGVHPVDYSELPAEFKRFDYPLGLEQRWVNWVVLIGFAQGSLFVYLLYLLPFGIVSPWTLLVAFLHHYVTSLGITVGAHRLWTHRSFKANLPLKTLLMLLQTGCFQYPLFKWSRDHRVHHKYTDTDCDPHNAQKGFWFSHMTWFLKEKHPAHVEKLNTIDLSDLVADPVIRFQNKFYYSLVFLVTFALPRVMYAWLFPEMTLGQITIVNGMRLALHYHFASFVNSVGHIWGDKPYDKYISPTENHWVSLVAVGEGYHNYHHTFPWDYKTSEYGLKINFSTVFINFFAKIGWASDLKTVSHKLLQERINRTGLESHPLHKDHHHYLTATQETKGLDSGDQCSQHPPVTLPPTWGWGDGDVSKDDVVVTQTLFASRISAFN